MKVYQLVTCTFSSGVKVLCDDIKRVFGYKQRKTAQDGDLKTPTIFILYARRNISLHMGQYNREQDSAAYPASLP